MQGIDVYLKDYLGLNPGSLPRQPLDPSVSSFIAENTALFAPSHPGFPTFNSTVIFNCTGSWVGIIQRLYSFYAATPKEAYESSMVYFDEKNAQSFSETVAFFAKNANCAANAIEFWWSQIQSGVSPIDAATVTQQRIDSLYNSGTCN